MQKAGFGACRKYDVQISRKSCKHSCLILSLVWHAPSVHCRYLAVMSRVHSNGFELQPPPAPASTASEQEGLALLQRTSYGSSSASIAQNHCNALWRQLRALISVLWSSGAWCMGVSAFVFSISALLVKLTAGRVPTFEIVLFRSTLSFLACAYGARQANIKPMFGQRQHLLKLIGRGAFGAAAMSSYYLCINALPLSDAVTLFFLNSSVTAIAAWAILREPLGLLGIAGVAVSVAGLLLLTQPPFIFHAGSVGWDHERILGTGFGVLSSICAAGAFICIRLIGKKEPALVMSVYFHVCAATTSLVPLIMGIPERATIPAAKDMLLLIGIAATSFWGQILIGRGFQLLSAAKASAVNIMQVPCSYLFSILLLHDSLSLLSVAGSVLILVGVILVNMRGKAPEPVVQPNLEASQEGDNSVEHSCTRAEVSISVEQATTTAGGDVLVTDMQSDLHDVKTGNSSRSTELQPLLASNVSSDAVGFVGASVILNDVIRTQMVEGDNVRDDAVVDKEGPVGRILV